MQLQTAIDEFLLSKAADGISDTTLKWYRSHLTAFARDFSPAGELSEITPNDLRKHIVWLRGRNSRYVGAAQRPEISGGLSHASISAYIRALHAFFAWCAVEYEIPNAMRNIKRPKHVQPEPKAASLADFVRIFNATGDGVNGLRDRAVLAFIADTGCRLGGLLSLTISNLDIANHRAVVIEKGDKQRHVFFTHFTAQLLYLWLHERASPTDHVFVNIRTGAPITASGVAQLLKRLKRRAGVTGRVNPHAFRHSFARAYIENGGDISTLAKLLGHTDVNTTAMYYAVFSPNELRAMHHKFSPLANIDLRVLFEDEQDGANFPPRG